MRLSVVLPVFNGARYLVEAIESILGQTRPAEEVIAVDDGSTDGSRAILERYPQVRIVARTRAGCAAARNAGAALATGEVIGFADQDDIQCPERFASRAACVGGSREAPGEVAGPGRLRPRTWDSPIRRRGGIRH